MTASRYITPHEMEYFYKEQVAKSSPATPPYSYLSPLALPPSHPSLAHFPATVSLPLLGPASLAASGGLQTS